MLPRCRSAAIPDVEAFLAAAGDFLVAREAEHNLIFGICSSLRETPGRTARPYLAVSTMRTGWSRPRSRRRRSAWSCPRSTIRCHRRPGRGHPRSDPAGRGRAGRAVGVFAATWVARAARRPAAMSERIYRLDIGRPASPSLGRRRIARPPTATRPCLARRVHARRVRQADLAEVAADADRWIARRGRTIYLWEDGEPVSLCGVGGQTPHGIRIGPVYTPPDSADAATRAPSSPR